MKRRTVCVGVLPRNCKRIAPSHRFLGGVLPLLLLLFLHHPLVLLVVNAQSDNTADTPAPAECLTTLVNSDLDGDNRLNNAEYFNAMMSLSDDPACPDLDNLSEMLATDSAFTSNFNNLKCACFDYRFDDPLCCQVFNFAIRVPDETYPVEYANSICQGVAQALWNECGVQVPWQQQTTTVAPTTAEPTTKITEAPTTAAPIATIFPTTAPTVRTVLEETTTAPAPTTTSSSPVSTPTAPPSTTEAPSSMPALIIVVVGGDDDDSNNNDKDDATTPGVAEHTIEETTTASNSIAENDNDDDNNNNKKTRTLAASLSVLSVVACAAVALLVQRYKQEQEISRYLEQADVAAAANHDDDDQHSIQAVAVKGAINPFGFVDSTEQEEISEVTLDDADLEAARSILAEGPVMATSYAQLQFVTTGGGGMKPMEANGGDHGDNDPTGPTTILPFRHLEKEGDNNNSNNKNDKSSNTPRVRMRRLLNSLAFEASPQKQQQQEEEESTSIHDHITPLKSNITSSRASPVEIFDSQDEDDFNSDQPSAAELLRNDSTDSWGAAMRRALGLGGGEPSKEQEQQHQQLEQEPTKNDSEEIQAHVNGDEQEHQQVPQHRRHMHHHHHHHHHHDLRPVPRTLDFDGNSSAPDSSAGGSGWSDGSSTTTLESQEEDETTPPSAIGNSTNNNEKQWEWVRSFGGQFQF